MNHEEHCDALEIEVARFAATFEVADRQRLVPSCPDWSIEDLARHLGRVHRWSERLVATLSPERIPFPSVDLGEVDAAWLRRGGDVLVSTLRDARPDAEMWSWGIDQHVRFWSRRQLHETMMHRVDLELALEHPVVVEPLVACDAIDEFLVNLDRAGAFSPAVRELKGDGELISFRTDAPESRWTIQLTEQGFSLVDTPHVPDVDVAGAARDVLLLLYRRSALESAEVQIEGDRDLLELWLTHSALE